MVGKLVQVLFVLMEVMGSQDARKDWNIRLQLYPHQRLYHGLRHELMAIDASINHQGGGSNAVIIAGSCEPSDHQGNFEGAGDLIGVNFGCAQFIESGTKTLDGAIDDVSMPLGANDRDPERGSRDG